MAFAFEELRLYQETLDWVLEAEELAASVVGSASPALLEALRRSALGVSRQVAQANGWGRGDRIAYLRLARGSLFECVAILQVLRRRGVLAEERYRGAYDTLEKLARMMSALVRSLDRPPATKLSAPGNSG